MDDLDLLVDLHLDGDRQGPGGEDATRLAIRLSGLTAGPHLKIADIGSGTGGAALVLARTLGGTVTAVDFLPRFLERLVSTARRAGLSERIETVKASMEALPFQPQSLDAIWSEGAVYNMGFENGVRAWRHFLKPGGILAVSDLTWLTGKRPDELHQHWMRGYPQVDTASARMALLETHGFSPMGYFPLDRTCWLDNYYRPMQARFSDFLARHGNSEAAVAIVTAEEAEIALYERYEAYAGYGFYIARKTGD